MREEKSDLRAQVYATEKTKEGLELTITTQQAQIMSLESELVNLRDDDSLVKQQQAKKCLFHV